MPQKTKSGTHESKTIKEHLPKSIYILIAVLLSCLLVISFFKRNYRSIKANTPNSTNELVTVTIFDDIKIKINKDMFSHDAVMSEASDNILVSYLKNNVKNGDTIIDVGYGIGIYSLLMAKLSKQAGRVYVYNPCMKYVKSIKSSITENEFDSRVFVTPVGISDHTFDGLLVHKNNFPIMSGKLEKVDYKVPPGYSAMAVKVSSIDEQLPKLQNIDLLRINANGDEGAIIDGAINLIKKSEKIKILLSFNSKTFAGHKSLERLQLLGFKLYSIRGDNKFDEISFVDLSSMQKGYLLLKK